ncbi:MAG TPA: P-loop NTPase fold protein [Pyrinomonadaceae bacterium]|nr:P-loop NTPase fold protein [Pyrinomonadaceae bacterium]
MAQSRIGDAVSLPPLVFISCAAGDEEWRLRLEKFLEPAVQAGLIRIWHSGEASRVLSREAEEAINSAKVAVVLLSDNYLASPIMDAERPLLYNLATTGKLTTVPILVRDCEWKRFDWANRFKIHSADVPLEKRSWKEHEEILNDVARQIFDLAEVSKGYVKTSLAGATVDPSASARRKAGAPGATVGPRTGPPAESVDPGASARNIGGAPFGPMGPPSSVANTSGPPPRGPGGPEVGPPGNEPHSTRLSVAALSKFGLSGAAIKLLEAAQVLATFGKEEPQVTTSCLLFAITELGRVDWSASGVGHFLWRRLQSADEAGYYRIFRDRFPRAVYQGSSNSINFDSDAPAQSITPNVLKVLEQAQAFTIPSSPPSPVDTVHILGALLINEETNAFGRLSQIVDVAQLRTEFLKFVARTFPEEDLEAWQNSLGLEAPTPAAEAAEADEPVDDFSAPLAGFAADFWRGEDLLDITRDVNALASLAAATSIDPPLSIGLFGDWGSGKSHFMRQMRSRVEKLSQKARESGKPQSELGYHKRIVQIEFNAWHYIEGNLWASLVEHIFNNLKFTEEQNGESHVKDARLAIMQKLELNQELKKKIEEQQQVLQGKADAAKKEFEKANIKRDDKWQDLTKLRQGTEAAVNELPSVTLSTQQAELLKQIGLPDGALHVPAEIQKKYHEARTFWGGMQAQWTVFRSDPKRLNKLIRILLVIAITVMVGWFFRNVLKTAWGFAASAVTFLTAAYAAAKPYVDKFNKSMAALKEKYEHVEQDRQKKIIALESDVTSLTNKMAAAESEAKAINAEVAKLEIELTTTDAAKLLANFIEDRAACSDYRRHLGVLALIRRDFEKLSELLSEQTTSNESSGAHENIVSRIILYIDDLDRCPPKNVVQVLQAIHLLLAFPLFVVIVGVDARWVTRSLQESYEWLAADENGEAPEQKKQDEGADNVVVTPHDYLEKIFQIPFWLKPMGDTECRNLLIGLTKSSRPAIAENGGGGQPASESPATSPNDSSSVTNQPGVQQAPASLIPGPPPTAEAQSQVISTGSEVQSVPAIDPEPANLNQSVAADQSAGESKAAEKIDLAPKSLELTDVEIEYMTKLSPLIKRSPRAVKRFLNCYRLIKVNLKPNRLEAFIGSKEEPGQFTAVMVLLGMITGAPTISLPLIEELEKYSSGIKSIDLHTFLQQLEENPEMVKHPDWALVRNFLEEHILPNTEPTFESLIDITPQVSRYSFRVAKSRSTRQRPLITKRTKTSAQAAV